MSESSQQSKVEWIFYTLVTIMLFSGQQGLADSLSDYDPGSSEQAKHLKAQCQTPLVAACASAAIEATQSCSTSYSKALGSNYFLGSQGQQSSAAQGTQMTAPAETLQMTSEAMISQASSVVTVCQAALASCKNSCSQIAEEADLKLPSTEYPKHAHHPDLIKKVSLECETAITPKITSALNAISTQNQVVQDSKGLLDSIDTKSALIGAAAGGVAGFAGASLLGGDEEEESSSSSSDANSGTNSAAEATSTSCASAAGPTAGSCKTAFLTSCGENVKDEGCSEFMAHYCDGSGEAAGAGDGQGSAFCAQARSRIFCENSSNAGSPECNWIASMPFTCKTNPAASECLASFDSKAAAISACNSYYSDKSMPKGGLCDAVINQGLLVSGGGNLLPSSTASTLKGSVNTSSGGTYSLGTASSAGPAEKKAAEKQKVTGSPNQNKSDYILSDVSQKRAPAAAANLPADIGGLYSESLFMKNSNHMQKMCAAGQLTGCY